MHELLDWEGSLTHRQFLTWQQWERDEHNQPSRADHYVMQVAAEIRRFYYALANKNKKVDLKDLLIKFSFKDKGQSQEDQWGPGTEEERIARATAAAKATWFSRVGRPAKVIHVPNP